jgi:hypothetical protein
MKTVGLIFGKESGYELGIGEAGLLRLIDGPDVTGTKSIGDGRMSEPDRAEVSSLLWDIASTRSGPALLFCAMNGRKGTAGDPDNERAPRFIWGSNPRDARHVLRELASNGTSFDKPVDVFLLTAQRTGFIHRYAQMLPYGSVVVGVETGPENYAESPFLKTLALIDQKTPGYQPSAKSLLLTYLLSEEPMERLPDIAVSGRARQSLPKVWNAMVAAGGISKEAADQLAVIKKSFNPSGNDTHQNAYTAMTRAVAIATPPLPMQPNANSAYAAALLTMWDKLFTVKPGGASRASRVQLVQPNHSTGSVSGRANDQRIHSGQQSSGSVTAANRRLTPQEMAAVPKGLRKAAAAAPGAFRKILRRH